LNRAVRGLAVGCLTFASAWTIFAAAQKSPPPSPKSRPFVINPAAVASGQKIYAKQCEICHFATSKAKKIGPGLANIYPSGKFSNGKKVDDAAMRVWIESGGKDMPGFKESLKPNEIRDLLAYLRTL
jgi:mono/diheme cytochrome c family protein